LEFIEKEVIIFLRQLCNRIFFDEFNNVEGCGRGGGGRRSRGHRYQRMLYYVYTYVFKLFSLYGCKAVFMKAGHNRLVAFKIKSIIM
jgi:hypothetical protein